MPLGIRSSAFNKAASATCLAGAIAFGVLAGSASASAAPVDCATLGATTIAPGICQIAYTASGTFTAPAGVTHLEALLVSGGSASTDGYAAGISGGVMYVDTLPVDTAITITVGDGGVFAGAPATGTSYGTGGTGDGVEPLTVSEHGVAGVLPSAFVAAANPASTLFPAFAGEAALAGDGQTGGLITDATPVATAQSPAGAGTSGAFVSALPNSGSGAGGGTLNTDSGAISNPGSGGSGIVLLRFAAPEAAVSPAPALAATGTDPAFTATAAIALLMLGGTAAVMATGRRRRSTL